MKKIRFFLFGISIFYFIVCGLFAQVTEELTETQEEIRALDKFLKEIAFPGPISEKLSKYRQGFTTHIKKDTAESKKDDFITSFLNFVQSVLGNSNADIENLDKLLELFSTIRESGYFSESQKRRLSTSIIDDIRRKRDDQVRFKRQIEEAIAFDFKAKLIRYRDLFASRNLNKNINIPNRQRLVSTIVQLFGFATKKAQKEQLLKFYDEIKDNKFLLPEQKEQIKKIIADLKIVVTEKKEQIEAKKEKTSIPQIISETNREISFSGKIKTVEKAFPLIDKKTPQRVKTILVRTLSALFQRRNKMSKEELNFLLVLFQKSYDLQNFLRKDKQVNQKATMKEWIKILQKDLEKKK